MEIIVKNKKSKYFNNNGSVILSIYKSQKLEKQREARNQRKACNKAKPRLKARAKKSRKKSVAKV